MEQQHLWLIDLQLHAGLPLSGAAITSLLRKASGDQTLNFGYVKVSHLSAILCLTLVQLACRQNSTEQGLATVEQRQPEYGVGQDARLRAIVVRSANGTVFDLSSTFRPNVAEYGVAVPPSFGTLCLLPIQGEPCLGRHNVRVQTLDRHPWTFGSIM